MNIQGIENVSFVDYPNKICATIFTGGCNFKCPYCHNSGIVKNLYKSLDENEIINNLEKQFPEYADNFMIWANQTSAMLQFIVWIMLADKNIGASLQHYNPIIDNTLKEEFKIDKNLKLIAQMPFGNILKPAENKTLPNPKEKIITIK